MSRSRPGHPFLAGAPLLYAHRGGAALAPENTLAAFRSAVEMWGADVLEMDVRRTRDGRLVVIHDARVDRTTDGSGPVSHLTLRELQELDAGFQFRDLDGRPSYRGTGVRIPLFRDVLRALPGVRMNVDAKDPGVAPDLVALVREEGARDRVLLACEHESGRAARFGYEGATSATRRQIRRFYLLHRWPGGGLYTPSVDALQVPFVWEGRQVTTPRFIREAHRRNIPVHVWTIDDPAVMRTLLAWGADGIQTDRPDILARVLHEVTGRPPPPGLRGSATESRGDS
ncbi:MAG: glycerophosphodiester phosphodiesterase [Gemmatimonadota bacterium]